MPHKSDNLESNTAILPKEIIDYIMDFHWRDKACLSACSLVCHAWTDSARRHLFRRLTIVVGVRSRSRLPPFRETFRFRKTIRPLYQLIRRTPHVQQYIKTLSFGIYCDTWRYESLRSIPRVESRRVWTWARYLSNIFNSLTAIEAFDFANGTKKPFITRCPPAIMASLSRVLRLASLKYFNMPVGSPHDMFHMLNLCPNVRHLSLGKCTIIEGQAPPRLDIRLPHRPIQLERLDVSFGWPPFLFMLDGSIGWPMDQVVRYDRLTHLSLNFTYRHPALEDALSKVEDVLRQTRATLTDLSMNSYLRQPLYDLIDMAKLERFEFHLEPGCVWSTRWLVDSFQHVPDRAVLEQFTLITEYDCHNWQRPREVWDVLDNPLAAWGSLREVRIWADVSTEHAEDLLPKLTALGKLNKTRWWLKFDWESQDRYIER
ncbi:hypothetical protein CYLTODRAFT_443295 [Cylindrobasidium torrendii FP15055 ss-10]|uniref:F-box domain-containing protein n=1 Tax=Cylindrobasidium torrendii FP15055 ss-10 TaxID=1314674 RepID=A0A0D7BFU1_9AGAR|nr:hypothetical protein CYLTODRAFT_443295 [Cylindrobasidium torrendii FP15055 ss-10]